MAARKAIQAEKAHKVMHEFKEGTLHSSSGDPVVNRKQAIAIAISEGKRAVKRRYPK